MRTTLVVVQCLTFAALGALLLQQGDARLGVAQILLGIVSLAVYW